MNKEIYLAILSFERTKKSLNLLETYMNQQTEDGSLKDIFAEVFHVCFFNEDFIKDTYDVEAFNVIFEQLSPIESELLEDDRQFFFSLLKEAVSKKEIYPSLNEEIYDWFDVHAEVYLLEPTLRNKQMNKLFAKTPFYCKVEKAKSYFLDVFSKKTNKTVAKNALKEAREKWLTPHISLIALIDLYNKEKIKEFKLLDVCGEYISISELERRYRLCLDSYVHLLEEENARNQMTTFLTYRGLKETHSKIIKEYSKNASSKEVLTELSNQRNSILLSEIIVLTEKFNTLMVELDKNPHYRVKSIKLTEAELQMRNRWECYKYIDCPIVSQSFNHQYASFSIHQFVYNLHRAIFDIPTALYILNSEESSFETFKEIRNHLEEIDTSLWKRNFNKSSITKLKELALLIDLANNNLVYKDKESFHNFVICFLQQNYISLREVEKLFDCLDIDIVEYKHPLVSLALKQLKGRVLNDYFKKYHVALYNELSAFFNENDTIKLHKFLYNFVQN